MTYTGGRAGFSSGRGRDRYAGGGYGSAQERYAAANASDDRTHHKCYNCLAEGSVVTLSNGVNIPIESIVGGRDKVLGWQRDVDNEEKSGLVDASVLGVIEQG